MAEQSENAIIVHEDNGDESHYLPVSLGDSEVDCGVQWLAWYPDFDEPHTLEAKSVVNAIKRRDPDYNVVDEERTRFA